VVKLSVVTPATSIGTLMERPPTGGSFREWSISTRARLLTFELPLGEVIVDSTTSSRADPGLRLDGLRGGGYRAANLVKVDVLVAGEPVDASRHRAP